MLLIAVDSGTESELFMALYFFAVIKNILMASYSLGRLDLLKNKTGYTIEQDLQETRKKIY